MKLWLDAQLPPSLARWIQSQPWDLEALPVRNIGLRSASDVEIFRQARESGAVVMTKDKDFIRLLEIYGPPPHVIWLRIGNSSKDVLQHVLSSTLPTAIDMLHQGEPWVEIRSSSYGST
jgi:predicted nuclease of predicted toxin-antitoxin system